MISLLQANTSSGDQRSDATAHAGQDILARPSIAKRVAVAALVVVAAVPVLPGWAIALWVALHLLATAFEQVVARARGYVAPDAEGMAVTFAISALVAMAALALIRLGDGGARFFAVVLIGMASVNVLLRFYSVPAMLLAAILPNAMVMAWVSVDLLRRYIENGDHLRAFTPLAILILYVMILWPAQRGLARAWQRLVEATALAQEREAAADQASAAKSAFLASMSHEIRTPLNGILGMAQAMAADRLNRVQRRRLETIRSSGEALLAILSGVLDLSKVETDELTLECSDFNLEEVVRSAASTFKPIAIEKGLTFGVLIAEEARGQFYGDPTRLRQIIHHLVSNAVKFTDQGGVTISVAYDDGHLTISIADTGIGIPADQMEQLFENFALGDHSLTRRTGGVGLGLPLSRRLVRLMGGEIEVSSTEGQGSLVAVTVPLGRGRTEVPPSPEASPDLRILVAEDNEVNRLVVATLLGHVGVTPVLVEDGARAVEAWRAGVWDLILMDIQMPGMDGVTATRAIRAAEAAESRPRTPIIAVTANAIAYQVDEYLAAGMDVVVSKPFSAGELFAAIEAALKPNAHAA